MSKNNLISRVIVTIDTEGNNVISWFFKEGFEFTNDPNIIIEKSKGLTIWEPVNTTPVTNTFFYVDTDSNQAFAKKVYYRIIVDFSGEIHISEPIQAGGFFENAEFFIVHEIMRKEYHRLKHKAGNAGWLLQKRQSGPLCTTCLDWDTRECIDPNCEDCYGTKYTNGYYEAVPYYMEFLPSEVMDKKVTLPLGEEDIRLQGGRCLAFPILSSNDIYVEKFSNRRYKIHQVKSIAEIRGIPLVYQVALEELHSSRIEFKIPILDLTN